MTFSVNFAYYPCCVHAHQGDAAKFSVTDQCALLSTFVLLSVQFASEEKLEERKSANGIESKRQQYDDDHFNTAFRVQAQRRQAGDVPQADDSHRRGVCM